MLRVAKLTKRIMKDKRLNLAERKALKTRRNIIMFRLRKKRDQMLGEMQNRLIPSLQTKVSFGKAHFSDNINFV